MAAAVIKVAEGAGALAASGGAELREACRDSRRNSVDDGEARHEAPPPVKRKNGNLNRRSDPGLIRAASQALPEHAEEPGEEKPGEVRQGQGRQGAPLCAAGLDRGVQRHPRVLWDAPQPREGVAIAAPAMLPAQLARSTTCRPRPTQPLQEPNSSKHGGQERGRLGGKSKAALGYADKYAAARGGSSLAPQVGMRGRGRGDEPLQSLGRAAADSWPKRSSARLTSTARSPGTRRPRPTAARPASRCCSSTQ
jgi:hypothetical protein